MKTNFVISFFTLCIVGFMIRQGQAQDTLTMSVYFANGKSGLQANEQTRLDSLVNAMQGRIVSRLRITGNADSKGNKQFNLQLSDKRAMWVYQYMTGKGIHAKNFKILATPNNQGITARADESSLARSRRVDIKAILAMSSLEKQRLSEAQRIQARLDSLLSNRVYPNGIRLKIPKGAFTPYELNKLNIAVNFITTMDKMLRKGITTMGSGDEVLASSGVFSMGISQKKGKPLPENFTFHQPIQVWIPVKPGTCNPRDVTLWSGQTDYDQNIVWEKTQDTVRLVRMGKKQYYTFHLNTLSRVNLACSQKTERIKISVKYYEPVSVKLVYPKTKMIITGRNDKEAGYIVQMPPVNESPRIYAVAKDADGTLYQISGRSLNNYKKKLLSSEIVLRKQDFRKLQVKRLRQGGKSQ